MDIPCNKHILRTFPTAFFEKNISAEKFIRLLQTHGIPYAIVPEDEWVPGIDDGEDVSGL